MFHRIIGIILLFSSIGIADEPATDTFIDNFITANKAWLQPDWNKRKGLVYDYTQNRGHLEQVTFDQQGNCIIVHELPSIYPDDEESIADAKRHGKPFHLFPNDPRNTYLYGEASSIFFLPVTIARPSVLFWGESGRANIATGWHWQGAVTFLGLFPKDFDHLLTESEEGIEYLLTLKPKSRDATFEMGTMLAYTSHAYLPNRKYERCEVRIYKEIYRPIEERYYWKDEEEAFATIRYSDWINIADKQVPRKIEMEQKMSETKSFSVVTSFREHNGYWLAEKIESTFHEEGKPDTGSTGTITVINNADEMKKRYQKVAEVLKKENDTQVFLADMSAYSLDNKAEIPYRINSPISIEIAGKTLITRQFSISKVEPQPWEYKIGLIEYRAKELDGKIIIDTDVIGTNFGTHYDIPLRCQLLDASGKCLAEIEKKVKVMTDDVPTKQTVSFEFDTFCHEQFEQFNFVRDYSYQFWTERSGLKDAVKVYDGMRLGNWFVDPKSVKSIQFEFQIGEVSGSKFGATWMYR